MKKYVKSSDTSSTMGKSNTLGLDLPDLITTGKYAAVAAVAAGVTYMVLKKQGDNKGNGIPA